MLVGGGQPGALEPGGVVRTGLESVIIQTLFRGEFFRPRFQIRFGSVTIFYYIARCTIQLLNFAPTKFRVN